MKNVKISGQKLKNIWANGQKIWAKCKNCIRKNCKKWFLAKKFGQMAKNFKNLSIEKVQYFIQNVKYNGQMSNIFDKFEPLVKCPNIFLSYIE